MFVITLQNLNQNRWNGLRKNMENSILLKWAFKISQFFLPILEIQDL